MVVAAAMENGSGRDVSGEKLKVKEGGGEGRGRKTAFSVQRIAYSGCSILDAREASLGVVGCRLQLAL